MNNFKTCLLALNFLAIWLAASLAHGQSQDVTLTPLAAFNNATTGANPYDPPVLGADGNLYGVLPYGGTNGAGVIFQVGTNGTQATFYNFSNWDGSLPVAQLLFGKDGTLYGMAGKGGTNGDGTIFEITTNGTFALLYTFGTMTNALGYALDGSFPIAGLIQARDGNFYGTTYSGGISNVGTVFQFATNGTLTTLHSFTGNGVNHDGAYPYTAPLVEGADGVFYGTTTAGGTNNDGTIFQVNADGTFTNLFEFNNTDGLNPYAGLCFGPDGKLYGTTSAGGTNHLGTVFQITTNGVLTTLYQFIGLDGAYPYGGLVTRPDSILFGTTYGGGVPNFGTVFQLTTNGQLTTIYSFTNGNDGANPFAGVIRDANGNLYGTALYAGDQGGYGTVYRLSFSALLSIISPMENELFTNSVAPVTGTASDNAPGSSITNVYYSLNGASWTNATTANGWINWMGSVMPVAASAVLTVTTNGVGSLSPNYNGSLLQAANTNSIAIYAVDNGGNVSATNTVNFVYGKNYAITATAGTGFVFTNWTGGTSLPLTVLTNGLTVQFVMASNLTLQANFRDKTLPTLSITNLTSGQRISNALFTVKGKAGDNWKLASVLYSLNGGGWSNAVSGNNWTNWSAAVTLAPGTNTVAAYAVDPGGEASPTNSVSFQFVVTNQLQIRSFGLGTIAPNYSNAW
ncbi:MAG TPA: choice-of-anchor tandem repeat GloVer-containing protein, partial [Verrucomicrobiae bacterium]